MRRAASALVLACAVLAAGSPSVAPAGGPFDVEVIRDVPYQGKKKGRPQLTVYRPKGLNAPVPAVMAVHGGSWWHGDKGKMKGFSKEIASHGFVVFRPEYTYATKRRKAYPRQPNDLRKALRYMRRHAGRYGIDPTRIGALGSSSGAHLVGLIAAKGKGSLQRGARVRAAVTWSAPFALGKLRRHKLRGAIRKFVGCRRKWCGKKARRASPVKYVSRGDTPLLMFHGRRELLPLSQPRTMAKRLKRARVAHELRVVGGGKHGAHNAQAVLGPSIEWLRRMLG